MIWAIVFYLLSSGDVGMITDHTYKSEKECKQAIADNPPPETIRAFCIQMDSI